MTKVYLSKGYTAWCGVCCNWGQVWANTVKKASIIFFDSGWTNSKRHGWRCKICSAENAKEDVSERRAGESP